MEGKNTDIYTSLPYTLYMCIYFIDHKHISRSDTRRWLSLIYIPSTSIHTSVNFFANQYFRFIRLTHHTIMNLSILPKRGPVWSHRYGNKHQILMIRDYREKKNQCDLLWIIHERQRYRGDISNNPQKNLLFYSSTGHAIFHQ